jgi:hypothetical protein
VFAAFDAEVEINSTWETIREDINISAKEKRRSYGSTEDAQDYWIKGKKLNCSGYIIKVR